MLVTPAREAQYSGEEGPSPDPAIDEGMGDGLYVDKRGGSGSGFDIRCEA